MKLNQQVSSGKLDNLFHELYGQSVDLSYQHKRYQRILKANGPEARWLFSTSGRTELGGNHTDHNHGTVLAASINLDTIAAVSRRSDLTVCLRSEGYEAVEISLDQLEPVPEEEGKTAALVRGIASAFSSRGFKPGGFSADTTSNVLKGSGLSSSAAIEVLIATIFNHLFAGDALSTTELARIGQYAENRFFGKPCGLMDQIACANGNIVSINFADPSRPIVRPVNFSFDDAEHGHTLIVIDTGGNHANLTGEYAAIPAEMKQVASYFHCTTLSEVKPSEFYRSLPSLRTSIGNDRAVLRAMHFFEETERAREMYRLLKNDEFEMYLDLVTESGRSSFEYLQNVYCSRTPGEQGISLCLALCQKLLGPRGAYRIQGGGFAGTVQAYVPNELAPKFIRSMNNLFGPASCTIISIRKRPTMCVAEA